jgi:hypothetical protein
MAKKKKPKPQGGAVATAQVVVEPRPTKTEAAAPGKSRLMELLRHPSLLGGWLATGLAVFAASAAFWFRHDMSKGAIREPTGMILWAAIAATLFASYWRESKRASRSDS